MKIIKITHVDNNILYIMKFNNLLNKKIFNWKLNIKLASLDQTNELKTVKWLNGV